MKIKLGTKATDSITGFEGVVTARIEYLNGCISLELEAENLEAGKPVKEWFDEQRLGKSKAETGGPGDIPPPLSRPY